MDKTYFLYLSRQLHTNVIESQVINWIEVLKKRSVSFDLLIDIPISDFLRKGKISITKNTIERYQKRINGKIYSTYAIRRGKFFDLVSSLIKALKIIWIIHRQIKTFGKESVIIQTRYMSDDFTLKIVKFFCKKIFIVFDCRGDVPVEFLNRMGYDHIEKVVEKKIIKEYQSLHNNQYRMCLFADKIFCVSQAFKDKLTKDFGDLNKEKFEVIPGGADSQLFHYKSKLRAKIRKELGLEKNIVLIYSGRLLHHWHKKDLIFEVISILQSKLPKLFFMCLTPDLKIANILVDKYSLDESRVLLKTISNMEINKFLNASDLGIIFRDNIGTNRVSSPTKVPEYLMAGLPILISEFVGDYSAYISSNQLGQVVSNNVDEIVNELKINSLLKLNKNLISEMASELYSKQNLSSKIIDIYKKL